MGKTRVGSGHVPPRFWVLTNKINVEDLLKILSLVFVWYSEERKIFYFHQNKLTCKYICYHPESGCHVNRPNQGISLRRETSLRTRFESGPHVAGMSWGGGLHFVVKDVLLHLTVLSGPLFLSFSRLCCLSCFNSFLDSCAFLWRKDIYNSQSTTVKGLNPGESILWFA